MAKKKKAVKRNDARGYSTTTTAPTAITQAAAAPAGRTQFAPPLNQAAAITTASGHQLLEELLELLLRDEVCAPPPTLVAPGDHHHYARALGQRLGVLHDTLTSYGFTLHQIRAAVRAVGSTVTVPAALDWLCLHSPTTELPPRFTEGLVRDAASTSARAASLTVIRAASSLYAAAGSNESSQPAALDEWASESVTALSATKVVPSVIDLEEDNDDGLQARKAWLLQHYQYEEENCDDGDVNGYLDALLLDDAVANPTPIAASSEANEPPSVYHRQDLDADLGEEPQYNDIDLEKLSNPETEINGDSTAAAAEAADFVDAPLSPDEQRLLELQCELEDLEADANSDANNYMRSKLEIKDLKVQVKKLRKQVGSFESKVKRQQAAFRKASAPGTSAEDPIRRPTRTDSDSATEPEGDHFSIFDDGENAFSNGAKIELAKAEVAPVGLHIPENSIPPTWTGKTPILFVEELCRKEKAPKPSFQKLAQNGCRLRLEIKSGPVQVEEKGPNDCYKDVQHYVSVRALYQINPTLPLYRLFPPFYRDLWMSWLEDERKASASHALALADERRELIAELIGCIPTAKTLVAGAVDVRNASQSESEVEEEKPRHDSPRAYQQTYGSTNSSNGVPTELGRRLKQQYDRREESLQYQTMHTSRRSLPIFSHREEILDTIRTNPVTILCAETGTLLALPRVAAVTKQHAIRSTLTIACARFLFSFTGSGKTTQCSSYVLEEALRDGRGDQASILCTQPRRVAAISVAERVAEELGDASVGKLVGYQIRMEVRRSAETRLLFCTTGVILRRLIEDPTLSGISHVVVDEVHERQVSDCICLNSALGLPNLMSYAYFVILSLHLQWQIDVLLVSLRALLRGARPDLKVILVRSM